MGVLCDSFHADADGTGGHAPGASGACAGRGSYTRHKADAGSQRCGGRVNISTWDCRGAGGQSYARPGALPVTGNVIERPDYRKAEYEPAAAGVARAVRHAERDGELVVRGQPGMGLPAGVQRSVGSA